MTLSGKNQMEASSDQPAAIIHRYEFDGRWKDEEEEEEEEEEVGSIEATHTHTPTHSHTHTRAQGR